MFRIGYAPHDYGEPGGHGSQTVLSNEVTSSNIILIVRNELTAFRLDYF